MSIVPVMQDLTIQEATSILGVPLPFLVKLLESGKLPFHLTGTHRSDHLTDLLDYKHRRDEELHGALDRMAQEAERASLYDKVVATGE